MAQLYGSLFLLFMNELLTYAIGKTFLPAGYRSLFNHLKTADRLFYFFLILAPKTFTEDIGKTIIISRVIFYNNNEMEGKL